MNNDLTIAVPSIRHCLAAAKQVLNPDRSRDMKSWELHKEDLFMGLKHKDFEKTSRAAKSLILALATLHQIFAIDLNSKRGEDWRADPKLVEAEARLFYHRKRLQEFEEGMQYANFLQTLSYSERVVKVILARVIQLNRGVKKEIPVPPKRSPVESKVVTDTPTYEERWESWREWVKDFEREDGADLPDDPDKLVDMFAKEVS